MEYIQCEHSVEYMVYYSIYQFRSRAFLYGQLTFTLCDVLPESSGIEIGKHVSQHCLINLNIPKHLRGDPGTSYRLVVTERMTNYFIIYNYHIPL